MNKNINPDLYALLPPDKKEEYKKLFPIPKQTPIMKSHYDSFGLYWLYQDFEFITVPEEWLTVQKEIQGINTIFDIQDGHVNKRRGISTATVPGYSICYEYV